MKTALKVVAGMAVCVFLFMGYAKQEAKIIVLQSEVELLQFMDSIQSSRIDHLREHTFTTNSLIMEAIKTQFNN